MISSSVLGLSAAARYGAEPPLDPAELWTPALTRPVVVDGPGGQRLSLNTMDTGGDGPVLCLVHGLSSSLGFWEHNVLPLARAGYRVLGLDLPGFGGSDRPDASYTPPWYAAVLARWADQLGLARPTWVGHSMGGHILLWLASNAPDRVGRLVLAAPAGIETFREDAARWMRDYWHERRALETREEEVRANFERLVFNRLDAGVERLIRERVRMQRHPSFRDTSRAVSRCIDGMLSFPVAGRLHAVRAPTLLVFGTEDRLIPNPVFNPGRTEEIARAGARAMPGCRLSLVPGAGHMVQHDDPDAFHAAVLGFLSETANR